jgi:hypothetical protein
MEADIKTEPTEALVVSSTSEISNHIGREPSAISAFPIAKEYAKVWHHDAELYLIPMTRQMEKNLGLLGHIPAWHFMFMQPDSPLEYYIAVYDNRISGATEAQPILGEQRPYEYLSIEPGKLNVDSDDLLQTWLENGGKSYVKDNPELQLDYRLVFLEGESEPIWSLFDFSYDNVPFHLISLGAWSGTITTDPFQKYR